MYLQFVFLTYNVKPYEKKKHFFIPDLFLTSI